MVCQAGVGWMDLNDHLEKKGKRMRRIVFPRLSLSCVGIPLFFPVGAGTGQGRDM